MANDLILRSISKSYPSASGALTAVTNVDLAVQAGEFVCLVGESGCGKSTVLRMIGGLETPSQGEILFNQKSITAPGLDRGMVFQESRLYPWFTVEENIAFGCAEGLSKADKNRLVEEHLALIGLQDFRKAYPRQLSGGMQQRAALARVLVSKPQVLLMDEPFGALDALTRIRMQQELLRIWQAEKFTVILVTHDIEEAVFLGDTVAVMTQRPGTIDKIIPVNLPRPRDRNSADFVGIKKTLYDRFF